MADQLYFSLWLRDFNADTMLRHFETLLRKFPFSRLRPGIGALRVYAIEYAEPTLLEESFAGPVDPEAVIAAAREFQNPDCAFEVAGWWELFQRSSDWELKPSPVTLTCYGPAFDNDMSDNFRLDLGLDTQFLPQPDVPGSARVVQSNLQSLVRLAHEVESALPLEKQLVWTEWGYNFSDRLLGSVG